jgi:hypothetical protein
MFLSSIISPGLRLFPAAAFYKLADLKHNHGIWCHSCIFVLSFLIGLLFKTCYLKFAALNALHV